MAYENKVKQPEDSNVVYGRNAVSELLKSGRDIDKIFVHKGEREGSISVIVAEAIKRNSSSEKYRSASFRGRTIRRFRCSASMPIV